MSATIKLSGDIEAGYERVADELSAILAQDRELGGAFAAYVGPRKVVDLWGGVADRDTGQPWREDTLQLIFSGTKGLTAGCMLLLIEEGLLQLDQHVSEYWPQFAAAGKQQITVSEVLSHQAGLPAITAALQLEDLLDAVRMADLLAAQAPHWPQGLPLAYHAITYGWLCDALARRVCGRSIGQLFAERIARPLNLEAWIGLPPEQEPRVSRLALGQTGVREPVRDPEYASLIYANPPLTEEPLPWNRADFHAAEIPAAGGIATARAMARYYSCLACSGGLEGVRICAPDSVAAARREISRGDDAFTGEPIAFGAGFELQTELMMFGPPRDAFGHCGAGGSVHGAWPAAGVGFSYCMNLMRDDRVDRRGRRLLGALADALELA